MTKFDAIVVIGSTIRRDTEGRAEKGAELFRNRTASMIILVGTRVEVEHMRMIVMKRRVPKDKIVARPSSMTTIDNAFYAKLACRKYGLKKIALVVSSFQERRACLIFRKVFGAGYKIQPFVSMDHVDCAMKERERVLEDFTPLLSILPDGNHNRIKRVSDILHEAYISAESGNEFMRGMNLSLKKRQTMLLEHL
jgi:DUF218 domain